MDIIRAPRSSGSILKPFLYQMMLQEGELLPNMLIPDVPIMVEGFQPQNYNLKFDGAVPASLALSRSLNLPAVNMLKQYGVLNFLEQRRGEIKTGGKLARELGVSRTAVWKAVRALREDGHDIQALPNSGYRLLGDSDGLSLQGIEKHLSTDRFGRKIELHDTLASTNSYIKGLDTSRLPDGFAVIADGQTAGRGRLGREFVSPPRQGVYLSVLSRPAIGVGDITLLTLCAAVAVCRAIETVCGASPRIKWVNDIYLEGKKVSGILSEAFLSAELGAVEYAVIGIGINTGEVDASVAGIATSIYRAIGLRGVRNRLAASLLNHLEWACDLLDGGAGREALLREYASRLYILGKRVRARYPHGNREGTVLGVDASGALRLEGADGTLSIVRSGEIEIMDNVQEEDHEKEMAYDP